MASTFAGHSVHPVAVLCPLGHALPMVLVRRGETREVECGCGAVVEVGPFVRDGAVRISWAMVRAPRSAQS